MGWPFGPNRKPLAGGYRQLPCPLFAAGSQ